MFLLYDKNRGKESETLVVRKEGEKKCLKKNKNGAPLFIGTPLMRVGL